MRKLIFFAILPLLLLAKLTSNRKSIFNTNERSYIENVQNLTSVTELSDFFDVQSSIYIDNAFNVQQKFFYKLLGDFPKSIRSDHIKLLVGEMAKFLEVDDVTEKLELYEYFVEKFADMLDNIFEYDALETELKPSEFNQIFVSNDVEAVLNYIHSTQMQEFVTHTGAGIRIFLFANRPFLDQTKILEFKAVVDEFLESETFDLRRKSLARFLETSRKYLD